MTTPNFKPGIGRLSTDRYDFEAHLEGTNPAGFSNFRHTADQTDIVNPNLVFGNPSNVEQALENLNTFAIQTLSNGQGFITVGDGYDTYHAANGTINFDKTIPSLDTLLNPLFQMIANAQCILAGTSIPFPTLPSTVPAQFARIQYGGIIVIKSGTYIVKNMITVPPAVTILGEGYGTKIVNASALNTSIVPPNSLSPIAVSNASNTNPIIITASNHKLTTGQAISVSGVNGNTFANTTLAPITVIDANNFSLNGIAGNGAMTSSPDAFMFTQNPIFFILPDPNRNKNDNLDSRNLFMFSRETRISNLVLGDNFIEPTVLGSSNYLLPQNHSDFSVGTFVDPSIPLIYQQTGSSLAIDGIFAMGKVAFSGFTVTSKTSSLVETFVFPIIPIEGANPTGGTILKINNCFIDGFGVPIQFFGLRGNKDFVTITNNKIRAYGYLFGDTSQTGNNTFVATSDANLNISNNYLYGNDVNVVSIADIGVTGSVPALQAKSKITSSGNNVAIGKALPSNGVTNSNFQFYTYNTTISSIFQYASISGTPTVVSTSAPYNSSFPYNIESNFPIEPYSSILFVDTSNNLGVISAATNTNPIEITTAATNAFTTGQILTISGVLGNTAANGTWTITVIDNTHFTLNGSTGNGSYVSGGHVGWTLNLPSAVGSGQSITIKDFTGNAATRNIAVVPPSGIAIEGIVAPKVFSSNFGSWTLVSYNDGTNVGWFII